MRTPTWHLKVAVGDGSTKTPRAAGFSRDTVAHMRISWLLIALIFSTALLGLQVWALNDYLYWRYVWFDVPMHFLGGLALGSFLVGFFPSRKSLIFLALTTCVFVGWEILEYMLGIAHKSNYAFDTALDLLMGTLGALAAYSAARFTIWRSA